MSTKSNSGPSLHVGTYASIPVFIHWSFGFIFFYIAYQAYEEGLDFNAFLFRVALTLSIFFCIVLHEYGHALTARRYGVKTRDIIIFPIGGVARLERIPKKPIQEFLMTLAGPLVNIAIALAISFFIYLVFGLDVLDKGIDGLFENNFQSFLGLIVIINIFLFLFNMLPAFPMDGGRLVRSLLAMKLGHIRATSIATWIGKIFAALFILYAVWDRDVILAFVGLFVFYSAHTEGKNNRLMAKLSDIKIGSIATTSFSKVDITTTFAEISDVFKNSVEKNFLVFGGADVVGSLPQQYIVHYLKQGINPETRIAELMSDRFYLFNYEDSLSDVYEKMNEEGIAIVGIKKDDQLIGVADRLLISKYL